MLSLIPPGPGSCHRSLLPLSCVSPGLRWFWPQCPSHPTFPGPFPTTYLHLLFQNLLASGFSSGLVL